MHDKRKIIEKPNAKLKKHMKHMKKTSIIMVINNAPNAKESLQCENEHTKCLNTQIVATLNNH